MANGAAKSLLASANAQVAKGQLSDGSETLALMAEFAALRTILLNVLFKEAKVRR